MKTIIKLFPALMFFICACANREGGSKAVKNFTPVEAAYEFIPVGVTKLTGGILEDRCTKNINNLYMAIDKDELIKVFKEKHDSWYAEPEFVGHYLASGPLVYKASGDEEILQRNNEVINAIIENQPESGYLGTYKEGLEFDYTFSVWNQNFLIKGLIANYELTGNKKAFNAATKCADYIADAYLKSDTLDLMFGLNHGIQHATILEEIAHLYRLTGKKLYLEFANYIIDHLENSATQVISIPNKAEFWAINFMMGCTKGIEMFNIYFGILEMYRITGDKRYLTAARNYWHNLESMHIRLTGNGTIGENWNPVGNTPLDLYNGMRPNENCVAMGWMKFNAELSQFSGESQYFNQLEKTLYNHIIGSQALDGHDFSYYQGNIGHKVHEKEPGAYSCCRYRGMRILAYLPGYVYMQSDKEVLVNLYTPSTTTANINDIAINIEQNTIYPKDGEIKFSIKPDDDVSFSLLLRKPDWCDKAIVVVDGEETECALRNGYLVIDNEWKSTGHEVNLNFEMKAEFISAKIENEERVAIKYGPLVLAIDSRYGTPIHATMIKKAEKPKLIHIHNDNELTPQVKFQIDGRVNGKNQKVTLVDYASAGSLNPGIDEFRLWIPVY